jgi:hypothetical protein
MNEFKLVTVPPRKIFQVPECSTCHMQFIQAPRIFGYGWIAVCECHKPNYHNMPSAGDKGYFVSGPSYDTIGKERVFCCHYCRKELIPGETVLSGIFLGGTCDYAHVPCHEKWDRFVAEQMALAERASKGIHITVWWSAAGDCKAAPNTGHADGEVRLIPTDLPDLPDGTVVYEMYTSPYRMSEICIPDIDAANTFWEMATGRANASYEIHWFVNPKESAARSFTGRGFSSARSEAIQREFDAGTM